MGVDRTPEIPFDALRWSRITIPKSTPQILTARFPARDTPNASSLLVRFPPGWSRPDPGHYPAHEEFLVLEGDLSVSGTTYLPGDYAWLPAGYLRSASHSATGCLALARFSGPPVWIPSKKPGGDFRSEAVIHSRWSVARVSPSPLGRGRARLLRHGDAFSSWILEHDDGIVGPVACAIEVFSLANRSWSWTNPGERPPPSEKPCFCRSFHPPHS